MCSALSAVEIKMCKTKRISQEVLLMYSEGITEHMILQMNDIQRTH